MDFICFIMLAVVALGVGVLAGREMDASNEASNWTKDGRA